MGYQIKALALRIKLVLNSLQYLSVFQSYSELNLRITCKSFKIMHVCLMSMIFMFKMFEMYIALLEKIPKLVLNSVVLFFITLKLVCIDKLLWYGHISNLLNLQSFQKMMLNRNQLQYSYTVNFFIGCSCIQISGTMYVHTIYMLCLEES